MGDIRARFTNHYDESRKYTIWDLGRDPNQPPVVFDDYLDKGKSTDWLTLHERGRVRYKRSDGSAQEVDVSDSRDVDME